MNKLRHNAFWIYDKLKHGKVSRHFDEISFILKDPKSPKAIDIQSRNLKNILNHAVKTTSYYKTFSDARSISDFPVIKKTIIQDNFDQFRSHVYKNKDNYKVSTSGSTGVPFLLYQNDNKRHRNHADVIYFLKQCHFEIGNKLYELEVWRQHNKKGSLKSWLQNVVQFDISRLTDERIQEFITLVKNDSDHNKTILGFASSLEMIAQYMEKNNIRLQNTHMDSIIANSEYLTPYTKNKMADYFDCKVLSRYSSEEIGIVAHQTEASPKHFMVNHASYYIEVLDFDSNDPVKSGEFGRIVVTDLFNYAMPMIRYDTGDIAKLNIKADGTVEFEEIEGRQMDLIHDTAGNIISSFVVYTKFYKYYELLKQYQFIQQGEKDYEIKLNLQNGQFNFEAELINDVKKDFGQDAHVKITYVDEIPPLASGKRRKVVNNYIKDE